MARGRLTMTAGFYEDDFVNDMFHGKARDQFTSLAYSEMNPRTISLYFL
jgi:hypothetical protein